MGTINIDQHWIQNMFYKCDGTDRIYVSLARQISPHRSRHGIPNLATLSFYYNACKFPWNIGIQHNYQSILDTTRPVWNNLVDIFSHTDRWRRLGQLDMMYIEYATLQYTQRILCDKAYRVVLVACKTHVDSDRHSDNHELFC